MRLNIPPVTRLIHAICGMHHDTTENRTRLLLPQSHGNWNQDERVSASIFLKFLARVVRPIFYGGPDSGAPLTRPWNHGWRPTFQLSPFPDSYLRVEKLE